MKCFFSFFLKVSCRRLRNKQLVIKKNIAKISYLNPISQLWSTL